MKLEVGKRYLTRNGFEAVIIGRSLKTPYGEFGEFIGTVDGRPGYEWRNDGRFYSLGECDTDLVSEITTCLNLHVGGRYLMANGKVATICEYRPGDAYPWHGAFGTTENGGMMSWNDAGEQVNGAEHYALVCPMKNADDRLSNFAYEIATHVNPENIGEAIFGGLSASTNPEPPPTEPDYELEHEFRIDHLRMGRSVRLKNYAQSILFVLLGIAALIYSTTASARDLASMPNEAGGEIVLTDIPANTGNSHIVYSRAPNGDTIFGRWTPGERYVVVVWDDTGTVKLFDYTEFRMLIKRPAPAGKEA